MSSQHIDDDFSPEEIAEINQVLDTADAEFERGVGFTSDEVREYFGLK